MRNVVQISFDLSSDQLQILYDIDYTCTYLNGREMRRLRLGITITFALLFVSYVYTIRKTFVQISNVSINPTVPLPIVESTTKYCFLLTFQTKNIFKRKNTISIITIIIQTYVFATHITE